MQTAWVLQLDRPDAYRQIEVPVDALRSKRRRVEQAVEVDAAAVTTEKGATAVTKDAKSVVKAAKRTSRGSRATVPKKSKPDQQQPQQKPFLDQTEHAMQSKKRKPK